MVMSTTDKICFIYKKKDFRDGNVKKKKNGLDTFRQSSIKQKDNKSERFLKNLESVTARSTQINIVKFAETLKDEWGQIVIHRLQHISDLVAADDVKTVKAKLLQKYGEDILLAVTVNKSPVVCFRNTGYKLLTDTWYNDKKSDPKEERLHIVRAAASIVLEDIQSQVYETHQYSPSYKM
ncbi:hypothetical protein PR048_010640 [Dryococelus australis]|uniref:Uncharacterized protein n=1 Tax=Dryococelus australis TaxID=614101 RepID=A0ABQ9I433_9NEOP|nr:hypothetical protein PR048_010640 [Dryococelus australis]